jgi:hypothetical protein
VLFWTASGMSSIRASSTNPNDDDDDDDDDDERWLQKFRIKVF